MMMTADHDICDGGDGAQATMMDADDEEEDDDN